MDVEIVAFDTVSRELASLDNCKPDIKKSDKLPSWDGEIYVYQSKKKEKQGLYDVIPVQVKGTERDSRVAGGIKYSVQIADLKNFMECRSGTTLYFVVFIHEEDDEPICEIYYEKFLPFDLKHILKECGNQDTVTITFKEFPKKKKEKARLLYDIVRDMKRQRASINADNVKLESILREPSHTILNFTHTVVQDEDARSPFLLIGRDYYFYVKRQDNILQPVLHGKIDGIGIPVNCPVIINDIEYYSMYERFVYSDRIVIKIGKATEFILLKNEFKIKLNICLAWKLSEDIRDVTFLLDLLNCKQVKLGEYILPCDFSKNPNFDININELKQHLGTCHAIQRLLKALDTTCDLDFSQVKDEQWEGLQKLYGFIVDENRAEIECRYDHGIFELELGNLKVLLYAVSDKQTEHYYEIRSFSDIRNIVTMQDGIQTSPFVGLSEEQIICIDNIKYENLFRQLETIPLSEFHIKCVTQLLYKMLYAYDKGKDKRLDILSSAIKLAEWLEKHDQYSDQIFKTINKMEAIKRSRSLNEQENEVLFVVAENTKLAPVYRSLAYLLLEEYKSAMRFYKQIPCEVQENLKGYPISRFWPKTIEKI